MGVNMGVPLNVCLCELYNNGDFEIDVHFKHITLTVSLQPRLQSMALAHPRFISALFLAPLKCTT